MNIQNSNKARLFTIIIGAVGLAISNQAQAACEYYRSVACPLSYQCFGERYDLVTKMFFIIRDGLAVADIQILHTQERGSVIILM
jgi:hypothetical protein